MVIGFHLLFVVPHTDDYRFRAVWDDERNLVLEALLLTQQGNDVFLDDLRKLRDTVGLQMQGNRASKRVNFRGCRLRGAIADHQT